MSRLDNSSWLNKELSDGGLRQILCDIDLAGIEEEESEHRQRQGGQQQRNGKRRRMAADPREVGLEKSKILNPKFSRFVDRLLLEAGVLVSDHPPGLQPDDGKMEHLMLAPVEKKVNNSTPSNE